MRLTLCKLLSMRKSDSTSATDFTLTDNFNSHPPCGGRSTVILCWLPLMQFQSTPSMRRATSVISCASCYACISIHTLHAEGDLLCFVNSSLPFIFQSTPSMRRATVEKNEGAKIPYISIHTLHAEGDLTLPSLFSFFGISIHTLHAESDRKPKLPNTLL